MFEIPALFQVPLFVGVLCGLAIGLLGEKAAVAMTAFAAFVAAGASYQWSIEQWIVALFGLVVSTLIGVLLRKTSVRINRWASGTVKPLPGPTIRWPIGFLRQEH